MPRFQIRFERVIHFRAVTQRFRETRCAAGHDYEFLKIDRRIRVRAAVQDVHHRHGKHSRIGSAEISKERQTFRRCGGSGECQRNGQCRVGSGIFFGGRTLEFDQFVVDDRLVSRIHSFENRRNLVVNIGNGFSDPSSPRSGSCRCHANSNVSMFACARPARNRRPSKGAAFNPHIDLDCRIAA